MVIKYRPHRGMLDDSMAEMQTFDSIQEMFVYIAQHSYGLISVDDLSISENHGKDSRIDWAETRYVCTARMGSEIFSTPQCIGMCSFEDMRSAENTKE